MTTKANPLRTTTGILQPGKSKLREILKHRQIYIILLPTLLFYLLFAYAPMFGVVIAFQRFSITKGIFASQWIGLENFREFLSNYKFWQLLRNTLSINILGLVFSFPAPIILALLLNELKNYRFKKAVQTITYMPHFISTVVISSMILTFVSSDGFINALRSLFGGEAISFMTQPQYFYTIYIISDIWQGIGWGSIIYIAALSSLDVQLYEAATIDGAGRWKQMLYVTLPGIAPTIMILLIMRIGQMLSVGYEKIMLLYNPAIYETADVISTYVYRRGLIEGDYSYSAAVGLFNSIVNFTLLVSSNFLSKKFTGGGLW